MNRFRLSNGYSFSVEFQASNGTTFDKAIRVAAMNFFASEGRRGRAQLHAMTDNGNWVNANYYKGGNTGPNFGFGDVVTGWYERAVKSANNGTSFENQMDGLRSFVTKRSPPKLRLVR